MTRRWVGIAAGLLVLLTGCITTEEVDLMRSDIRRLKRELRQIRDEESRVQGTVQSALDPVASRLKALQKEIEAVRRLQADFESRLVRTQRAAAKATGAAEERRFREQNLQKELRDVSERLEARLSTLERELTLVKNTLGFKRPPPAATTVTPSPPVVRQPTAPAAPAAPATGTPAPGAVSPISPPTTASLPTTPATPPPAISDDSRAQAAALALLKAGKLSEARKKFQDFLRRFPTSPLADDAQFWIGQTYYEEKRYDKAILEFDKVVINYAKGDKVPGALLKQGFAFLALGDKASAKQLLNQLVVEYPDSEEARTARSRLSAL